MKTVCAWCAAVISDGSDPISHGICPPCRAIMSIDNVQTLQSFLDGISVPVVVLDSSLSPMCTNRSGKESFHLHDEEVAQHTLGEVVVCDNSHLPEGCGHTIHCSGCVLRNTITETYNTGQHATMVPAKLTSDSKEVCYYVSSVKVGDCVVVKLDTDQA